VCNTRKNEKECLIFTAFRPESRRRNFAHRKSPLDAVAACVVAVDDAPTDDDAGDVAAKGAGVAGRRNERGGASSHSRANAQADNDDVAAVAGGACDVAVHAVAAGRPPDGDTRLRPLRLLLPQFYSGN